MDTEYTKGFKAGMAFEQERIIKLLEEMPTKAIKTEHGSQILSLELKDIIALINGEQKWVKHKQNELLNF